MKWTRGGRSADLEDQRGGGGGSGGGRPGMRLGIGGFLLLAVLSLVFKKDLFSLVGAGGMGPVADVSAGAGSAGGAIDDPREEELVEFVSFVLDDAQATWTKILPTVGGAYSRAKLVLFRDGVDSACGYAGSSTGPFYCPGDQKVYLDMDFFDTMSRQLGAPGEFARAYVIAHEVGHHVQTLLGATAKVDGMRGRVSQREQNALSVRLELQADCYAGIWAHHSQQAKNWLDQGDIESAVNAAEQIGDDTLQRQQTGTVRPDAFTHGSSAQRVRWFTQGLKTGSVQACDTFRAQSL